MNTASKLASIAAIAASSLALPALSMTQTWDFSSGSTPIVGSNNGNSLTMSSGTVSLTVTAWSDSLDVAGDDQIESAKLIWAQSGALGIQNRDEGTGSPHHAIDSVQGGNEGSDGDAGAISGEDDDMLLLIFSEAVDLTGIDLSWAYERENSTTYSRADVSILYWNGTGDGSIDGGTWANILTKGYVSAGNYADVVAYQAVNAARFESTRWLVGVYNNSFGAGSNLSGGNDGFKLDKLASATRDGGGGGQVPLPGTLTLLLLGLATLFSRRKQLSSIG